MRLDLALQVLSLCVLLAATETLHGIARTVWLAPRVGKARAVKISILSGSLLAFLVCLWRVPLMGVQSSPALLALGATAALFMAAFDLALGHWLLRRSWRQACQDFNPATGNYLLFGLVLLVFHPLLVMRFFAPATV